MTPRALSYLHRFGIRKTIRRVLHPRISRFSLYRSAIAGRRGIEIGGPSKVFASVVPVYPALESLDNAVYSADTIWADNNGDFKFHSAKPPGRNLILDGTDLGTISDARFDFVLSCHSLEHIANPVKALKEWQRVTRPGGHLILILPDYRFTFDRKRLLTTIEHMLDDYAKGTLEDDAAHLEEVLALHDRSADPNGTTDEQFQNFAVNRCLHHHTFDEHNTRELLQCCGYKVLDLQTAEPFHIVALAYIGNNVQ